MAAMVTTAKASLISYRSTSSAFQPVLANRFFSAPTGAVVNQFGSCECWLWATMRASGLTPSFSAVDARISTMAAAPSEIDEELAAVTVPSLLEGGLQGGDLSGMALVGASSVSITVSPLRPATVTGAISLEAAVFRGGAGAAQRFQREGVLLFAGEGILGRAVLGEHAHGLALVVGVFQAVQRHVVVHGAVAVAVALAALSIR